MIRTMAVCALSLAATSAGAFDASSFSYNGFLSAGAALSDGNNLFGSSTDGSLDYHEAGLNAQLAPYPGLLLSAQGIVRKAGGIDDGKPRLDFAFIDWQPIAGTEDVLGLRLGRIKNRLGLYNDVRDVVFTRPSILLPSLYLEGQGVRDLLFSSDGGMLYYQHIENLSLTEVSASYAPEFDASGEFGSLRFPGLQIRIAEMSRLDIRREQAGGVWRYGLTYTHARVKFRSPVFDAALRIEMYTLFGQHNRSRWSYTGEYQLQVQDFGSGRSTADSAYLQVDRHFGRRISAYSRVDMNFADRDDRHGRECARRSTSPCNRYSRFTYGLGLGVNYRPAPRWGIWAEVHEFYGTSTVASADNPDPAEHRPHWTLGLLMVGYRF